MFRIGFFHPQSATDLIIRFVSGQERARGKGLSFVYGPRTIIVRVPTTDQIIPFRFVELTADRQEAVVQGEVSVSYEAEDVLKKRDFTIDPTTGAYLDTASQDGLQTEIRNSLQTFVRTEIKTKKLNEASESKQEIEAAVQAALKGQTETFKNLGVKVSKFYVTSILPANPELKKALEAKKREELLGEADKAIADRRQKQADSDRSLRTFEAETNLNLEKQRAELVSAENTNLLAQAEAEKQATILRLSPYETVSPAILLGLALREMAQNGSVGQLNISPELLSALQRTVAAPAA